ncbi:hypothetical protein FN846DRAFT_62753 [Sphaerosporella brunnea]|uniref:NmrA-like domain-containing protein n=1 Tax=Sphaerosporella brunnea TaxID=1250544 RepID=A0A5J5EV11_9PEZI|nr:hypothetical protein FN846DRAFT_62753 [Sphaerosporella brunnea]
MSRNLVVTYGEGQTGHLIIDLLLSDENFSKAVKSLHVMTCNPEHEYIKELDGNEKASVIACTPGDVDAMSKSLKDSGADTILLIPPAVDKKLEAVKEMVEATKKAGIANMVLLSSAGADMAERDKQQKLREFVDIEVEVMKSKEDTTTAAGHCPCLIRAGFYAENLLLYNKYAQDKAKLPLPMGAAHKISPVALRDIALLVAHVVTSTGEHGLGDKVRGQLITMTGPTMATGIELAEAAAQGLGTKLDYEEITENDANKLLEGAEISEAEKQYILEYYSLARESKTNYISTHAFHDITGQVPTSISDFFKSHASEFKPKKRRTSKTSI